jgi:WhiB family transcriptional regulator, redox-sensing transcriptional regulator
MRRARLTGDPVTGTLIRPVLTRTASALPEPIFDDWQWQVQAACRGLSTDLFFKADDEPRSRKRSRETQAKAVCAVCPVTGKCLDWAVRVGETHGVWGGLSAEERGAKAASLTTVGAGPRSG